MNMENWVLVTYEPVELEKKLVEVQDSMRITVQLRTIYGIYFNVKKNQTIHSIT